MGTIGGTVKAPRNKRWNDRKVLGLHHSDGQGHPEGNSASMPTGALNIAMLATEGMGMAFLLITWIRDGEPQGILRESLGILRNL